MKVAIIGSRKVDMKIVYAVLPHIPANTTEIVSGGARGIDTSAELIARSLGIKMTIFKPDYETHGKTAPLKRNEEIINYSDYILAFWDGVSRGTKNVITTCIALQKPIKVIRIDEGKEVFE